MLMPSPYLTCDNEYFQIILKAKEKRYFQYGMSIAQENIQQM